MRKSSFLETVTLTVLGKVRFVPRLVNSKPDPHRDYHEWPVDPLRGSTEFYADAAFSSLRVLAAQNHNGRVGLTAAVRCDLFEGPLPVNLRYLATYTLPVFLHTFR